MTPEPQRLRILKAFTAGLGEINGAPGGYHYDLTPTAEVPQRVFRGRVIFGASDPLPMISILEAVLPGEQTPGAPENPNRLGPWDLMIQGFVDDDFDNPTDPAQFLLADTVRRLALEKKKSYRQGGVFGFPNTILRLDIGVGVVRPPDEISAKAYFWLPISLEMSEDLTDPYFAGD